MGITTGIQPMADLTTGSPTNKQKVDRVLALIADPGTSPANKGTNQGFPGSLLDEMSPIAAAQLRVELAALSSSITNV